MKHLAKSNGAFREESRREDAGLLRRAFWGRTQQAIADNAARALGVSPRQVIYWLHLENDMPSWAVKAATRWVEAVERAAQKIEGSE